MFTIKPKNEKKLIKEVTIDKAAERLEPMKTTGEFGSEKIGDGPTTQIHTIPGTQSLDTSPSLSSTGMARSGESYVSLPEEVGYISKIPVRAHVMSWLMLSYIPGYAYAVYHLAIDKSPTVSKSMAISGAPIQFPNTISSQTIEPSLSILVIFILIMCISSRSRWVHWLGIPIAAGALYYQSSSFYQNIHTILNAESTKSNMLIHDYKFWVEIVLGQYWILFSSIFILLFVLIHLIRPKYWVAYN